MRTDGLLSQDEIDRLFADGVTGNAGEVKVEPYDFRRADRMPRDQLRSIRLLHENFARTLASSLSAYLRAYVTVNVISVEQLSFREFSQCLSSPTVLMLLEMSPYDGSTLLEINPALAFPIIEMVLGGSGKTPAKPNREVTEIEATILQSISRVILHDLQEAWRMITDLSFRLLRHETEPQLVQILAPNEAVVAVCLDVRIADHSGTINVAVPSLFIKMLRQKFAERAAARQGVSPEEQHRVMKLIQDSSLHLEVRLEGGVLRLEDLLNLSAGEVVAFDHPLDRPIALQVNGKHKYMGYLAEQRGKRVFLVK
jgi:flagellar motor switch protein FliM